MRMLCCSLCVAILMVLHSRAGLPQPGAMQKFFEDGVCIRICISWIVWQFNYFSVLLLMLFFIISLMPLLVLQSRLLKISYYLLFILAHLKVGVMVSCLCVCVCVCQQFGMHIFVSSYHFNASTYQSHMWCKYNLGQELHIAYIWRCQRSNDFFVCWLWSFRWGSAQMVLCNLINFDVFFRPSILL